MSEKHCVSFIAGSASLLREREISHQAVQPTSSHATGTEDARIIEHGEQLRQLRWAVLLGCQQVLQIVQHNGMGRLRQKMHSCCKSSRQMDGQVGVTKQGSHCLVHTLNKLDFNQFPYFCSFHGHQRRHALARAQHQ
jgi:hypothetical protein